MTLNKKMLAMRFREIAECTHADAKFVIDTLSEIMVEELAQNNRVMFGKIGTLSVSHRKERSGYNPGTKEKMMIPARPALKVTPTTFMKQHLIEKLGKK